MDKFPLTVLSPRAILSIRLKYRIDIQTKYQSFFLILEINQYLINIKKKFITNKKYLCSFNFLNFLI